MLPSVYRLWARTRIAHLQPCIAKWAMPEMYAGIEGQGAEEAAYRAAIVLEHCKFKRGRLHKRCGGHIQVLRSSSKGFALPHLVRKRECRNKSVYIYKNFLENMVVYNTVVGGVG